MKGETTMYLAGQVLFREGDPSGGLFFIKEGRIEIYRERDGTEILLGTSNPGDVLGTVTLFSKEPRTASARAVTQSTVLHLNPQALEVSMKDVPTWAQALLKDAVARLKYVDEKLVETKLTEKKLIQRVGTPMHHACQLTSLLAGLVRLGLIKEDDIELFPLKGFIPRAEQVLLKRAEYLESLFAALIQGGLVKQAEDKKFGSSLMRPKVQLLDDFSVFCLQVARKGIAGFAPTKLYPWMGALVRVQKRCPGQESFAQEELADHLSKEMGRTVSDILVQELMSHGVVRGQAGAGKVTFSVSQVQRRMVFENTCRLIKECKEAE